MPKPTRREPTTDGIEIIHRWLFDGKPEMMAELDQVRADLKVARKIYDLREKAGLTQAQLAKLIGTSRTVISRLEDADYEGHSLAMLNRIATALNQRVEIRFVPLEAEAKTAIKTATKATKKKAPVRPRRARAAA